MVDGFYRTLVNAAAPVVRRRVVVARCLAVACTICGTPDAVLAEPVPVTETRRLMGVPWTITVYAEDHIAAATAIAAGFTEVRRLEKILSDYDPQSELSRLSARAPTTAPVTVGEDLWRVLTRAVEVRDATESAFDPTVGPLTSLWRQARRTGRLPATEQLAAARRSVGPEALTLSPESRGVSLERPGMRLDLGGIGMGYAVDRTLEVLGRHGIEAALVDASGDIGVSAAPPGRSGWTIDVAPLRASVSGEPASETDRLILAHQAVTTSGDAYQAAEIDGRRYSHIVDPRTGIGVSGPTAVTVVAKDCVTADAIATAASVLGPQRAKAVIAGMEGCSLQFVWLEEGRLRRESSPGWTAHLSQPSK